MDDLSDGLSFLMRYAADLITDATGECSSVYSNNSMIPSSSGPEFDAAVFVSLTCGSIVDVGKKYESVFCDLRDGCMVVATFLGDGSCLNIREALAQTNVRFKVMGDIRYFGDAASAFGLSRVVCDADMVCIAYSDARTLLHDLTYLGLVDSCAANDSLVVECLNDIKEPIAFEIIRVTGKITERCKVHGR